MASIRKITVYLLSIITALLCLAGALFALTSQHTLEERVRYLESLCQKAAQQQVLPPQKVVEKIVSSKQLWRPVQDKVRDTVVQVFSHISAIDMLRPYAPPSQASATGSGFFIDDQGYLITNAHVVNQAESIWIQIPSLGKCIIDVELVGISPARDLALLHVTPKSLEIIRQELGAIPFLPLGDSDLVYRSDEVLALGYPLGQQYLKSTTGVVSGREHNMIQTSAPINPGNSGGPLVNAQGEVVGINSSGVTSAQNVGYAIPINILKGILSDLHEVKLLRKPFLGVLFSSSTKALVEFLGNPESGGCYVVEVIPESTLDNVGVQRGDMIYNLNGYEVDRFGEMIVPWSEDKISITDFVSRLSIGDSVALTIYRKGTKYELVADFDYATLPAIRRVYPGYEPIDYEVFGGMVVMELTKNHISGLQERATGLAKFLEFRNQREPSLIITHIFSNSQLFRSRTLSRGSTLNEINGIKVKTLEEFRRAVKHGATHKFMSILASDNVTRASDNVFVVLPMQLILEEEKYLSRVFKYQITDMTEELLRVNKVSQELSGS